MINPQEDIEFMLDLYNYEKREYGYVRDNPKGTSRAITVWYDKELVTVQMFGWFTNGPDVPDYKIYDTGLIGVTSLEFQVLLEVFDQYKNIDG